MNKRKVLLIGWDAADWEIINPLLDAGKMPALSSIINNGVMGNIATLEPVISPILWNSIATGKTGDKHGVLGFTEASSMGGGIVPSSTHSRKTKAIWNILQQNGYKCHQIGWWASHPAEPLNGTSISNMYGIMKFNDHIPQPIIPGTVYPPQAASMFDAFRISPYLLTKQILEPFIPDINKIDIDNDRRFTYVSSALSECTNYHSAATYILENQEWDFVTVYQRAIDSICHQFMKYFPPKLDSVSNHDFELYKHVVEGFYIYHDMMLGQLLLLAGTDATVMIVSDHGFQNDARRNIKSPLEPAGIAYDHRQFGIFCAKGPGIAKDEIVYGAGLLDIAPTILNACGLPVGSDMDGKVLSSIYINQPKIDYIDSWDEVEGDSGFIGNTEKEINHFTTKEELKQLIDLGYIDNPGENIEQAVDSAAKENKFNLARIYQHTNKLSKAIEILEELTQKYPKEPRFPIRLAQVYQLVKEFDKSQQLIEKLKIEHNNFVKRYENTDDKSTLAKEWKISLNTLLMLESNNLLGQAKFNKALENYITLEGVMPNNARVNLQKARVYTKLNKYENAIEECNKCLTKDSDNTSAHLLLASCYFDEQKYNNAVESALDAIGGIYKLPKAHLILGKALYELHDYENAAQALEVCLHMTPELAMARNLLIEIYTNNFPNIPRAAELAQYFENKEKDAIIVVSGIPRSGTSLMMQLLEAAGYQILTDNERTADESNPKGYYEYEPVKNIAADSKWIPKAKGKVVKIISQLLFHLPENQKYKVIFMNRSIEEVIASQQHMIAVQNNVSETKNYPLHLEIAYKKNIEKVEEWHKKRSNVDFLNVDYSGLVNSPSEIIKNLEKFLGKQLPTGVVERVVEPSLYRSKAGVKKI